MHRTHFSGIVRKGGFQGDGLAGAISGAFSAGDAAGRCDRGGHAGFAFFVGSVPGNIYGHDGACFFFELFPRFPGEFLNTLFVVAVRAAGSHLAEYGMAGYKGPCGKNFKAAFRQDVAKLKKGVIISPVSVNNHGHSPGLAARQVADDLGCMGGHSASKNRNRHQHRVVFRESEFLRFSLAQVVFRSLRIQPQAHLPANFYGSPGGAVVQQR